MDESTRDPESGDGATPRPRPVLLAGGAPRAAAAPRTPHARPDPTPARLAIGGIGLAALSAALAGIVGPAQRPPASTTAAVATAAPTGTSVSVERPVRYVQLQPGETAPPGATVIDATAPKPITIVTKVAAPPPRPVVVRTTQSGKVLP